MNAHFDFRGDNAKAYESREPEVLLAGAAGTGKSLVFCWKMLTLLTKYPKCRGLFCRGTRASLTQSGLVTWENVLHAAGEHSIAEASSRRVRQSYEFPNASELVVAGLDDPGKTLSSEYDFVYIMEATEEGVTLDVYETLLRALRNGRMVKNGLPWHQVMMDCNPTTPTHWLYKRQQSGKLRMYTSTHKDNPAYWDEKTNDYTPVGRQYVEGTLARMTGARRARFYEGVWTRATGVIYDGYIEQLEPAGHLHDFGWKPNRYWKRFWAIDWGFTNPACLLMAALDDDNRLHFYKEFYATRTRAEELAKWARAEVESGREPLPVMTVCDHDPEAMETFRLYGPTGCPIQLADKGDKTGGIEMMQERFDDQGDGKFGIYFTRGMRDNPADDELESTGKPTTCLEELLGYKWDRSASAEKNDKDLPVDVNNHAMDAARYLCKYVAKFTQAPTKNPKPRRQRDPFSRLDPNTWR